MIECYINESGQIVSLSFSSFSIMAFAQGPWVILFSRHLGSCLSLARRLSLLLRSLLLVSYPVLYSTVFYCRGGCATHDLHQLDVHSAGVGVTSLSSENIVSTLPIHLSSFMNSFSHATADEAGFSNLQACSKKKEIR